MEFENRKNMCKFGKITGYIVMYIVFTTVLFFALTYFNKIPSNWGYVNILAITSLIILFGTLLKFLL